jgi:formylglycine-generating enzyme
VRLVLVIGITLALAASLGAAADSPLRAADAAAPSSFCKDYSGLPDTPGGARAGMVRMAGGRFRMGSDEHYAEEALAREVVVDMFWIDRHDVTNAQFARFVATTGYVTVAERMPDLQRHPELLEAMRVPGSAVFEMPRDGRSGRWRFVAGANWRQPDGPASSIADQGSHPVVHVAYEDAQAYASWAGRELPTEAQWEYAARGGLNAEPYAWGARFEPDGRPMANTWQGAFPIVNTGDDGFLGTSPVGCFSPNRFGLFDMAGNVWQWTDTWYVPGHSGRSEVNPTGPEEAASHDPRQPGVPAKVIKGGSHLCAPNFCARYRPAARQARETDSGTSHIGFRTVLNEGRASLSSAATLAPSTSREGS